MPSPFLAINHLRQRMTRRKTAVTSIVVAVAIADKAIVLPTAMAISRHVFFV